MVPSSLDNAKRQRTDAVSTPPVSVTIPSVLTFGGGCSLQLPKVLTQLGLRRPMIVTLGTRPISPGEI